MAASAATCRQPIGRRVTGCTEIPPVALLASKPIQSFLLGWARCVPSACSTTASRGRKHTTAGEKIDGKQQDQSKCFWILDGHFLSWRFSLVCGIMKRPKIGLSKVRMVHLPKKKESLYWEVREIFCDGCKNPRAMTKGTVATLKSSKCIRTHNLWIWSSTFSSYLHIPSV